MAGTINHTAEASGRLANSPNQTAGGSSLMAGTIIRLAGASSRTAGASNHANKSFIHTADGSSRTNNSSSRASKSFIGAGRSSSRTVFRKKQAKTGKNRLFSPSSRTNCAKSDNLPRSAACPKPQRAATTRRLRIAKSLCLANRCELGQLALRFTHSAVQTIN